MGQKFVITEQDRKHTQELLEKYVKNPFYTAKSFDMGDLSDFDPKIDERAAKYTEQLSETIQQIASKEGRLVVKKMLENLLDQYSNRTQL